MNQFSLPRDLQNVPKLQQRLKSKPESYWIERGEKMALELFHQMSKRVPAYVDFLAAHKVDPKKIKTIEDFATLPTMNKDNYLRLYPREALCWDGTFSDKRWVISTTSGSTGEPFYFPRTELQDDYYATTAELYLRENFHIQDRSTLYIDAFAMGAWIGGVFTYEAIRRVASKGYNLSVITPGIHIQEVLRSVEKLGPNFDQVIIGCYPPILKDIIDIGIQQGLEWDKYNLGLVFSAEGFSEEFRDYVVKFGNLSSSYLSTLNHYGTVDLGTMSHETPTSVMVRRQAVRNNKLFTGIFGEVRKLPTFTQYMPEMFYFEAKGDSVLCSSFSGIPLVRYDLKDNGGIVTLAEVCAAYKRSGKELRAELEKAKIDNASWNLPFVYVYERSDFSVTLVGGTIYVEEIRKALFDRTIIREITGRFTMEIVTNKSLDNKLLVNVELKEGMKASSALNKAIRQSIVKVLLKENSEFVSNYKALGRRLLPIVKLWPHGHDLYFNYRGKQKWVKK